jgi:polygalacturonase
MRDRELLQRILIVSFACLPVLHAQDTRQVSEPSIPPACTTVDARLSAPGGVLSDAAELMPDTRRIQAAIDSCAQGHAVMLRPAGRNNIFLAGPLQLKPGVTLVVEANAALFASRNPRDYDVAPGSCGIVGDRGAGCKTFITADHAPGSAIMGDGAIDGRGGAKLIRQNVTWWDLAKSAKVLDKNQAVPRLISVRQSNGFTLYRITLRNSPNFHVGINDTNGFTAWGVKIRTPKTARNTDGIDPSSSTNVTIAYCDIDTGDDNVAIKTGSTPAAHMTIAHNHFYSGHGMSIGSGTAGGVSDIRVTDLSIDGADNGIRIKSDRSRGGVVERVTYENVCMRNVANPILLTSMYTTFPGDKLPVYRDILLRDVHSLTPGWVTYLGLDAQHKLGVSLDNVTVDGQAAAQTHTENAEVKTTAGGTPVACAERFPQFPETPTAPAAAVTVPAEDATLYVAASGTGDYYSIQHAIDVAPATGAVISIAPGIYRERLKITKPNIHLRSAYDDPKKTVIVFDDSAASAGGTTKSATVEVHADNFTAENLTFSNDYNRTHEQVSQGSQALALLVNADRAVFRNMRLLGNQDTVYAASKGCSNATQTCTPARQYFVDCYIEGNVDFIFGDGNAVFENCEIHNTMHKGGYLTAQGKSLPNEDSAYVFNHCRLTAEPGVTDVYLGRPWRPYAAVVFLNTEMGAHISPAGWHEWHAGETHYLDTAYYAEYNSSGPGAHPQERDPHTKFLTAAEAAKYETKRFLAGADGWDPTGQR